MSLLSTMLATPADMDRRKDALLNTATRISQLSKEQSGGYSKRDDMTIAGMVVPDSAMRTTTIAAKDLGGIDLTPANMDLQTKSDGGQIKFHMDPAMLAQLQNAPGFTPIIINVQPLKDLPAFLGVSG